MAFFVYFFPTVLVSSQAVLRIIRPASSSASQGSSVGLGRWCWGSGGWCWGWWGVVLGRGSQWVWGMEMGMMSGMRMLFWESNYLNPPPFPHLGPARHLKCHSTHAKQLDP